MACMSTQAYRSRLWHYHHLPGKALRPYAKDFAVTPEINVPANREIDPRTISSPLRSRCAPLSVGEQSHVRTVGVHNECLIAGVAAPCESNLRPVRRPRRPSIKRGIVCKIPGVGAVQFRYEHFRVHFA